MKKKVLHVLSSNDFAGAENVAMCIISNMSDSFECAYASPIGGIKDNLASRGIRYIPIQNFSYFQIHKVIKEWKPDIVHAHDFKATIKCLSLFRTIPVVSHIHQNPTWLRKIRIHSILFFLACYQLAKIIVVSPAIKETTFLSRFFKHKTEVISNIVDRNWITQRAQLETGAENDIAFIGRFEDVKDPLRFINIVAEVVKELPNLNVIMMGGGTLEERCKKAIRVKKLEGTIDVRDFLDNPYPLLKSAKMLVMTSKSEGLPMVAIEALAFGKPVLVPRLNGIENIVDASCGFICNSDQDFVKNIVGLSTSTEKYKDMSLAASKRAAEICDMDLYRKQVEQVYRDAVRS
ncbi:glycosyltransferase [Sporosarcina sp. OR05]|uniref:glycosyltransferase n=1 Tax=Sporosarcina sp. OR05 TaxID=2969819 RepID=UPI00352AC838